MSHATDRSSPSGEAPHAPPTPRKRNPCPTVARRARHRRLDEVTALVVLSRPVFWPVAWVPVWFGSALAARSWWPPFTSWWEPAVAAVVVGPLTWGSVSALNDLHDLDTDLLNPRKAGTPLVTGRLRPDQVRAALLVLAAVTVLLAIPLGAFFTVGTCGILLLGWAYSAPPFRLKGRPGWDVAANAVTVGALAPWAGWSLVRPPGEYPPLLAVLGVAVIAALYLPTTAIDHDPDRTAAISTFAVRWGERATYRAGVSLWAVGLAAWCVTLATGALDATPGISPAELVAGAAFAVSYPVLVRRPSLGRLAVVSSLLTVSGCTFLAGVVR